MSGSYSMVLWLNMTMSTQDSPKKGTLFSSLAISLIKILGTKLKKMDKGIPEECDVENVMVNNRSDEV